MFHLPEKHRWKEHPGVPSQTGDVDGFFIIPHYRINNYEFWAMASNGLGWEHVSISIREKYSKGSKRCPTWEEMCWVKDQFWDKEDCVIQYHPSESEYVNCHHFCLHLWRPIDQDFPIPPKIMVGL